MPRGRYFSTGRRLKRLVPHRSIAEWTMAATGIEEWMLGECYAVVGDGAETAALVMDQVVGNRSDATQGADYEYEFLPLAEWVERRILPLRDTDPDEQRRRVLEWCATLDRIQRFILFKLLTGEFRVECVPDARRPCPSRWRRIEPPIVAARLMVDGRRPRSGSNGCSHRSTQTTTVRDRIRSASRRRSRGTSRRSAIVATGRSNGSGMASARS